MSAERAVVGGALAAKPGNGGEAWVRLSWLLGLRRLGFHVGFVEELTTPPSRASVEWFEEVTAAFGIAERWLVCQGELVAGPGLDRLLEFVAGAALLVNISGNLRDARLREVVGRRVYVDVDPGYTQLWQAAGEDVGLGGHDHHFTVGLKVGSPSCRLPAGPIDWEPTLPPVVLDEWPVEHAPAGRFTTVGSWRGGYGRVGAGGALYGQKAHEFRKLAELPSLAPYRFEAALRIDEVDAADREALADAGWELVDPRAVAGSPEDFRAYVTASSAELSPAQGIYVETACGWVSDRTAHYLAAGKPAVVQETGLSARLPVGEGLLTFSTPAEAAGRARDAVDRHGAHASAARQLAEDLFDSDRVIGRILERAGVAP